VLEGHGTKLASVLFDTTAYGRTTAASTLFALGVIGFAAVPAFTGRVLRMAATTSATTLASSAAEAVFNLGNAAGAYLGGRVIAAGHGSAAPTLVGAAALLVALISVLHRRSAAPGATAAPVQRTGAGRDAGQVQGNAE